MKPEDNYRYTTSEMAQYYGLTAKGLAFYENKGIISPRRSPGSKYRDFSLVDCYHLYDSKFYSNCGFSLAETAELIQSGDLARLEGELERKRSDLQRQILYQQRLKDRVEQITRLLRRLPELTGTFREVESPPCYRLFVRRYFSPHESTPQQSREFALWNRDIPINVASLRYALDELEHEEEQLNVGIGNIIRAEDFQALGYRESPRTEYLPSRRCIYTVVMGQEEDLYRPTRLQPCLEYIRSQNLRLAGDPYTAMIIVTNTPEGRIRFDQAWFPVEENR